MRYSARVLSAGQLISLNIEASSEEDAFTQLQHKGFEVVSAKLVNSNPLKSVSGKFPILLFSQELLALLKAGLGLVEAIEGITEKEHRPEIRAVLQNILNSLYQGQKFSATLKMQPQSFPVLYSAMIYASEKTGDLPEALTRYIVYEQQVETLKKKIITSSIYPLLLMVIGGLVVLFLLGYVVPRFSKIYADVGTHQTFLLQIVLSWADLIEQHGKLIVFGILALLGLAAYALSLKMIRAHFLDVLWKLPVIGEQMRVFQLARFYRMLSMLLAGGITVLQALEMAKGLLSASLHNNLAKSIEWIRQGKPISDAMQNANLVTPVSMRMLLVGEKSGEMSQMMEHIAALHDEEISRWLDWFTRLFEPLLMIFIGLIIGSVVVMLYMPIFELAGSLE